MNLRDEAPPLEVLAGYGLDLAGAKRAASGLINKTWIVTTTSAEKLVVQCLHSVISASVNDKIDLVTQHLEAKKICTPRLVKTATGKNSIKVDGNEWRVLSYVAGTTYDAVPDEKIAQQAGAVLARFHSAFSEASWHRSLSLSGTHNLPRYLDDMHRALAEHRQHHSYAEITELAQKITNYSQKLPNVPLNAPRVVHGDPKISNILFDNNKVGLCLVDLDTVGLMPLAWEFGDAFRSWCNPCGEDTEKTSFSPALFRAALDGYLAQASHHLDRGDLNGIVSATQQIYTELAARFCTDALRETYFAWDPKRFSSRVEHNLVRARGQMNAAIDLALNLDELTEIVLHANAGRT
jgi:Ser/Thr protein kinase RdoA (MazF antagonist)